MIALGSKCPCENITTDRGRDDAVRVIQGFRAISRQIAGRVESSGGSDAAATGTATSTATGTAESDVKPGVGSSLTSPLTGVETTPSELYKDFVPLVGRLPGE
jgi:hypothetical protein